MQHITERMQTIWHELRDSPINYWKLAIKDPAQNERFVLQHRKVVLEQS
jgi:hypothetical protein